VKKLLLLLLLSLAFLGSANANSIEGAFGYKFGDVVKGIKVEFYEDIVWLSKSFKPSKPVPGLSHYSIYTTINDKKVYKITASHIEDSSNNNSCDLYFGDFGKIFKMLEARYGDFEEYANYSKYGTFSNGVQWFDDHIYYKYDKNNRRIVLECKRYSPRSYELRLMYIDYKLSEIMDKESKEWLKQKVLKESSDYDL
jgi:hypothetical protein